MDNENKEDQPNVQADNNSIAVGGINIGGDISGNITIGHTGYTVEQVSVLLTQITSTFQPKPFDGRCPYKGLDVFEEDDADLFFGRERLVEDLASRVKESRTVFITGPSGSGKSSLVRAGLIHALKQGAIKNLHSERWLYETMKPGREPIKDLALAFSRLKSPDLADYFQAHASEKDILNKCAESVLSGRKDQRFVLFIDQFEEVFTQMNQEEERLAFLTMLAHAATVENGRVIVLFAMRSDFVANCATYPALNEMLSQQFRQIGAMQPEELVSAIALPAKHVGLPIEGELIARIINDMKGEPGALPLMQFALKDLFDAQQAKGGVIALTLEEYLHHGGIHKSLERHADNSFAKLSEGEQELARSIFSGLIEIGRGTQDTRRTALFDELVPANAKATEVESVVQRLADARLIITDEQAGKDTVTISHEKLIDAWPWLKKLVNENRDVIALQNEIAADAKEWDDHRRDPSYLYAGSRLANAREKLEANKIVLSGLAYEFVIAGQAQQRLNQRRRMLGIAVPIGVIFLIILFAYISTTNSANLAKVNAALANTQAAIAQTSAVLAQANAEEAQKQAQISRAGELAAQSNEMREQNFRISLLLGLEAFRSWDIVRARGALLDAANANPQLLQYLTGHTDPVYSVAFSPDGKTLASGSYDEIILWDVETRQPIGQPLTGHISFAHSVAFSPDGKTLASGSCGKRDEFTYVVECELILWDVETRQPIGQPLTGHTDSISVAFSPDGKIIASLGSGTIILWDVETRQPIGQPLSGYTDVAFSPDGKILASGSEDYTITLWDVETGQPFGQPLTGHTDSIHSVAFSPDGKTLASGSADSTIIVWDVETGQPIGQPLTGHTDSIHSVAFSPDGKTLASGSEDNTIILWDVFNALYGIVDSRQQIIRQSFIGHTSSVNSVAFSPDGKTLASLGLWDPTIFLWNVETRQPLGQPFSGNASFISSIAFSPDGKTLASGSDNTIILWDMETRQPIGPSFMGHANASYPSSSSLATCYSSCYVHSVAFSPDGKTLASGNWDHTIILWDVETRQPIGQPLTVSNNVLSIAFSKDGKILASSSSTEIILWDVETRRPLGPPLTGHASEISSVALSPDGKTLASGSYDKTIILWNAETRRPLGQPLTGHAREVYSVAFSPNGRILASGSSDQTIILWDMETRQPIGQPLIGHTDSVLSVAFSPDGKTLASSSYDNTIILWDVETRQPIGQPLTVPNDVYVLSIAFSPNGETLASLGSGTIILWDMRPEYWIEQSCQRVGRNFTRAEWERYFPNEEYRKTCDQWPLEPEITPTATP